MFIIGGGPFGGGKLKILSTEPKPSITKKITTIFSDTKTEGQEFGYSRAADEYNSAYRTLKKKYDRAIEIIKAKKELYNSQASSHLSELENLKKEKIELETRVRKTAEECAMKNSVSTSTILGSLSGGSLASSSVLPTVSVGINLIDIIYGFKIRQRNKAAKMAYVEARESFDAKLAVLREDFEQLKKEGDREISSFVDIIGDILVDISRESAKLAELYGLLG